MNGTQIIIIAACFCILSSTAIVIYNHIRTKKTFDHISKMLDNAMDNNFSEKEFDESRLSALETKFAHYLSHSAASAKNVAAERDKIKSLISDISHQTKTPIANLLLYSELLSENELPKNIESNINAIHQQTENLRFLIDSLVKLSRLENGILTLSPKKEPINPMLQSVCEQFLTKAEAKGLKLSFENTDTSAIFDPKWTSEALGNIIDNAIKYTESGSIILSVAAYDLFARIDVADTGIGISKDEIPKIFSRFYRSENVRASEGVGIGLYLVREIISREGGYIKVSAALGKGSTFSVFLPK